MIKEGLYKIGELNRILSESADSEFKPRIEKSVTRENQKNNSKAVKDMLQQSKANEKGITRNTPKNQPREDYNNTTLDYDYVVEPDKTYKDRVKKLVTNSALTEFDKNSAVSIDGNENFYKQNKEINKKKNDIKTDIKTSGLTAKERDKKQYENNSVFESKKMKRLNFKNTIFLSESEVLKRVPDSYKTNGNRFLMKDASDTEYLIECNVDEKFKFARLSIIDKVNKKQINENLERMKSLYNYSINNRKNILG